MILVQDKNNIKFNNTIITIGKFDGIHLGHQELINKITKAKKNGETSVMFTFIFTNDKGEYLYTLNEKRKIAEELGIDILVEYPFDEQIKNMDRQSFIKELLVKKMDVKKVVVGKDFRFGHNREGNSEYLLAESRKYGFETVIIDKLKDQDFNKEVSSTLIKNELKNGNIENVTRLLGRNFSFSGEVCYGKQLGRTIGIPTVNIVPDNNKILPPYGVYATKTVIDRKEYNSITNIGEKPTVGNNYKAGIETNIFDFNENVYGKTIKVMLYSKVRDEKKFTSMEKLAQQMQKDIYIVKNYLLHESR